MKKVLALFLGLLFLVAGCARYVPFYRVTPGDTTELNPCTTTECNYIATSPNEACHINVSILEDRISRLERDLEHYLRGIQIFPNQVREYIDRYNALIELINSGTLLTSRCEVHDVISHNTPLSHGLTPAQVMQALRAPDFIIENWQFIGFPRFLDFNYLIEIPHYRVTENFIVSSTSRGNTVFITYQVNRGAVSAQLVGVDVHRTFIPVLPPPPSRNVTYTHLGNGYFYLYQYAWNALTSYYALTRHNLIGQNLWYAVANVFYQQMNVLVRDFWIDGHTIYLDLFPLEQRFTDFCQGGCCDIYHEALLMSFARSFPHLQNFHLTYGGLAISETMCLERFQNILENSDDYADEWICWSCNAIHSTCTSASIIYLRNRISSLQDEIIELFEKWEEYRAEYLFYLERYFDLSDEAFFPERELERIQRNLQTMQDELFGQHLTQAINDLAMFSNVTFEIQFLYWNFLFINLFDQSGNLAAELIFIHSVEFFQGGRTHHFQLVGYGDSDGFTDNGNVRHHWWPWHEYS